MYSSSLLDVCRHVCEECGDEVEYLEHHVLEEHQGVDQVDKINKSEIVRKILPIVGKKYCLVKIVFYRVVDIFFNLCVDVVLNR